MWLASERGNVAQDKRERRAKSTRAAVLALCLIVLTVALYLAIGLLRRGRAPYSLLPLLGTAWLTVACILAWVVLPRQSSLRQSPACASQWGRPLCRSASCWEAVLPRRR